MFFPKKAVRYEYICTAFLLFNVNLMLEKCSLRYRNLTNLKKIKQMDSFAVLNVSHRFHELHGFDTDKSLLLSVAMRTD